MLESLTSTSSVPDRLADLHFTSVRRKSIPCGHHNQKGQEDLFCSLSKTNHPAPLTMPRSKLHLVLFQLLPNHMPNGFFDGHRLNGVLQCFVDQGLIATFAGFGLEVLNDRAVEINIYALFSRQHRAGRAAFSHHQLSSGNSLGTDGCILRNVRSRFLAHVCRLI